MEHQANASHEVLYRYDACWSASVVSIYDDVLSGQPLAVYAVQYFVSLTYQFHIFNQHPGLKPQTNFGDQSNIKAQ